LGFKKISNHEKGASQSKYDVDEKICLSSKKGASKKGASKKT
jgi:hypothetical protein